MQVYTEYARVERLIKVHPSFKFKFCTGNDSFTCNVCLVSNLTLFISLC